MGGLCNVARSPGAYAAPGAVRSRRVLLLDVPVGRAAGARAATSPDCAPSTHTGPPHSPAEGIWAGSPPPPELKIKYPHRAAAGLWAGVAVQLLPALGSGSSQ